MMDVTGLTCYKRSMPGPKKKPESERFVQIPLKVPPEVAAEFYEICKRERRKPTEMARFLLMDGIELYHRVHPAVSTQQNLDSGPGRRQNRERLIYAEALTSPQPAKNKKRKGATGTDG